MLRAWWKANRLPALDRLNVSTARQVLDHIAAMEWGCRPFDDDPSPVSAGPTA